MHYHAIITREGKHHLAAFADAPGCQTFAESEPALREAATEALDGWLEAHLAGGEIPPRPRRRPSSARGAVVWSVAVEPRIAVAVELRWARERAGLSQSGLAKRAGVSQQQIAKLERPGENPTVGTLSKVAAALGISLEIHFGPSVRSARSGSARSERAAPVPAPRSPRAVAAPRRSA